MALFWHLDLGREGGLRQCRRGSPLLLCTYPTLNVRSLRRAIRHCSLKWLSCFGLMLERVVVCSRSDHCSSLVSDGHHKPPLFVIHTWNSENDRSVWSSVLELSFFFAVRSRSQCVCVCESGLKCVCWPIWVRHDYQECRWISCFKVCSL